MAFVWLVAGQYDRAFAQSTNASTPAIRAEAAYQAAHTRYHLQPDDPDAAWQLGRACFDRGEFATNDTDRAAAAQEGIDVCERAADRNPKLAATHYYLAMDLGELARTKSLGALPLLRRMEQEWSLALQLDEAFDYAGPDRNLGILYTESPGWPLSIGSRAKARQHLLRAVRLHPDYPENHLNLIEAYQKWNDRDEARAEVKALQLILPQARKQFSGPDWESSWTDWDNRWHTFTNKLKPAAPPEHPGGKK